MRVLLIAVFVGLVAQIHAEDSLVEKDFAVHGSAKLHLTFPSTFQLADTSADVPASTGFTVKFTSKTRKDFVMLFTGIQNPEKGAASIKSLDEVKKLVEEVGQRHLQTSVESKLNLTEMRGLQAKGYYFSLTDITVPANPKPNEYKYMTQGVVLLGDVIASFTILSNTPDAPERTQGVEVARSARYFKGEAR